MINTEANVGERKHVRRSLALLVLGSLIVLVAAWKANAWKEELPVKDVRVSGENILSAKDILELADVDRSARLYSLNLNAIRRRLETNPYVQSVVVARDVPGTVVISVHERTPVVAIVSDKTVYLDDSARVLPPVKSNHLLDLPILTGAIPAADYVPGRLMRNPAVREALALLDTARAFGDDLYHRISEVHIAADGGLICYTAEQGVPVAFGHGNFAMKLARLDGFWKEFVAREGAQALEYVDLRFDDQVVARWNQRQELAMHERVNP
ncbi:MAG: FtsQ-type POTRA domain-containing protein [Bacteroidota bacterium]